jgi:TOBE domain
MPHVYFDWTEGNPVAHLLRFLIFGSGEVAPVSREVLREAEPIPSSVPSSTSPERRPEAAVSRPPGRRRAVDSATGLALADQGGDREAQCPAPAQRYVRTVELGAVTAEITVDVAGQEIVTAITRSSAERLGLAQGAGGL